MFEGFLTVNEAANIINKTTRHIARLCSNGELNGAQKVGKMWFIPLTTIQDYKPKLKGFAEVWRRRREKENEVINTIKEIAKATKS